MTIAGKHSTPDKVCIVLRHLSVGQRSRMGCVQKLDVELTPLLMMGHVGQTIIRSEVSDRCWAGYVFYRQSFMAEHAGPEHCGASKWNGETQHKARHKP